MRNDPDIARRSGRIGPRRRNRAGRQWGRSGAGVETGFARIGLGHRNASRCKRIRRGVGVRDWNRTCRGYRGAAVRSFIDPIAARRRFCIGACVGGCDDVAPGDRCTAPRHALGSGRR